MTPKEKAKEIFDKMYFVEDPMGKYPMCFDTAKQCALIAIDEILQEGMLDNAPFMNNGKDLMKNNFIRYKNYWQEVKQEIEKL